MVAKTKLYRQLDGLETDLAEQLSAHLKVAARGNNDWVFCVTEFRPAQQARGRSDRTTEKLIALSRRILTLYEKLDEPSGRTPAARLCWYCQQWSRAADDGKLLGQTLARQFLAEIEAGE